MDFSSLYLSLSLSHSLAYCCLRHQQPTIEQCSHVLHYDCLYMVYSRNIHEPCPPDISVGWVGGNRQDIIFGGSPTLQSDKTLGSPTILPSNTTLHLVQDKSLGFKGPQHCQLDAWTLYQINTFCWSTFGFVKFKCSIR